MVKTIGIDPVPTTRRAKLCQFVLWSWRNTIFKTFSFKGRTSRAVFFVFSLPVICVWLGIASWFTITDMDKTSDLFNELVRLRLAFGALTLISLPALIIRRLHDSANKVVKGWAFGFFGPFGSIIIIYRLLFDFDVDTNKHGPPNTMILSSGQAP